MRFVCIDWEPGINQVSQITFDCFAIHDHIIITFKILHDFFLRKFMIRICGIGIVFQNL